MNIRHGFVSEPVKEWLTFAALVAIFWSIFFALLTVWAMWILPPIIRGAIECL